MHHDPAGPGCAGKVGGGVVLAAFRLAVLVYVRDGGFSAHPDVPAVGCPVVVIGIAEVEDGGAGVIGVHHVVVVGTVGIPAGSGAVYDLNDLERLALGQGCFQNKFIRIAVAWTEAVRLAQLGDIPVVVGTMQIVAVRQPVTLFRRGIDTDRQKRENKAKR